MTLTTQQQQGIIEAGRGAYRMLIDVSGNPHSKQLYRDLWDKGWRLERKKDEAKNKPRNTQPQGRDPKSFRKRFGSAVDQQTGRYSASEPQQGQEPKSLVLNDRLVRRFNNKFQTRAA